MAPINKHHAQMADHHLALHEYHTAFSEHFGSKGDKTAADLHTGMAGHHIQMAESHHDAGEAMAAAGGTPELPAEQRSDARAGVKEGAPAEERADRKGGHDTLAVGAATQLHNKGYISTKHRDTIHKKARSRPFGSMSGAGHEMGTVDETNSAGTNSGAP